jgi:hypothetical protein
MVAHMDTVHDINHNVVVKRDGDNLYAFDRVKCEQYGIGGDDKVGIFITLELLRTKAINCAAFFVDEEVGCQGSSKFNKTYLADSTTILQCDRKGNRDFTNTILGTQMLSPQYMEDVADIVNKYSRRYVSGGMTDVHELASELNIPMANMSCGYYNPHTNKEYININDIEDTINFCTELFNRTKDKEYFFERPKQYAVFNKPSTYTGYNGFGSYDDWYTESNYVKPGYATINERIPDITEPHPTNSECNECSDGLLYYDDWTNTYYCDTCFNEFKIDTHENKLPSQH